MTSFPAGSIAALSAAAMAPVAVSGIGMKYCAALFVALALVGVAEWFTDEDIMTMLTIIVASASLGWMNPPRSGRSGLAVGLVVPAIAIVSQVTHVHPSYESAAEAASHGPGYAASLLVLIVPAVAAAYVGRLLGGAVLFGRGENVGEDSFVHRPRRSTWRISNHF